MTRFANILAKSSEPSAIAFSRAVRHSLRDVHPDQSPIQTVATGVAGPVLAAFVLWVLDRCKEAGIDQVYFLSRDGEVMLDVADSLPAELTSGFELRRLEVSRAAISVPAASLIGIDNWVTAGVRPGGFLVQQRERIPGSTLVTRAGLSLETDAELLSSIVADAAQPFSDEEFQRWLELLAQDRVRARIAEQSRSKLQPVIEYFAQEGLADPKRSAMIDVGWTGQQAAMLSAIAEHVGGPAPLHLHVGRLREGPTMTEIDQMAWLFDDRATLRTLQNPVALFETFCATDLGGVSGYERRNDEIAAIRRGSLHGSAIRDWGLAEMQEGILDFARSVRFEDEFDLSQCDLRSTALELLEAFWHDPTAIEAAAWGAFPYERDERGTVVRTLAMRYDYRWLRARIDGSFEGVDWPEGSLAISSAWVREVVGRLRRLRHARSQPGRLSRRLNTT